MADDNEPFVDERPPDEGGGNGGSGGNGGGGSSGGGGGGWGSSGGGGSGGSGWGWGRGNGGGGSGGSDGGDDSNGEWGSDKKTDTPYLKTTSLSGHLIKDSSGFLLSGAWSCVISPPVLMYLRVNSEGDQHVSCALCKLDDAKRKFTMKSPPSPADGTTREPDENTPVKYGYFSWARPGKFAILGKWQSGHWDYSKMKQMRVIVYGVDLGWQAVPLTSWGTIAKIEIKEDYTVWVNDIKGDIDGNKPYMVEI